MKTFCRGDEFLMNIEVVELKMLVIQTAACVLQACQEMPTDGSDPVVGAGRILAQRFNWASHGFTNALLEQADFLHSVVEGYLAARPTIKTRGIIFIEESTRQIVADALSAFQEFKAEICRREQTEMGKGWGTATGFFQIDWSDLNEQLLNPVWEKDKREE